MAILKKAHSFMSITTRIELEFYFVQSAQDTLNNVYIVNCLCDRGKLPMATMNGD